MTTKEHIREGRDSGFSWCCIAYFLIRMYIGKITGKWLGYPTQIKGIEHVLCPFHYLYYLISPIKSYFYCGRCRWLQYGNPACFKCLKCKHVFPEGEPKCFRCDFHRFPKNTIIILDKKTKKIIKQEFEY